MLVFFLCVFKTVLTRLVSTGLTVVVKVLVLPRLVDGVPAFLAEFLLCVLMALLCLLLCTLEKQKNTDIMDVLHGVWLFLGCFCCTVFVSRVSDGALFLGLPFCLLRFSRG